MPADGSQSLAVIGSRKINYYGISAIEAFVPKLVSEGWTIVSGGAVGADTAAHRVTVDSGGRTIAVLGSGLLNPYPLSNKRLFADILDSGGTLLSPFSVTMTAMAGNFPARNRIIAGLSELHQQQQHSN
jgi:DNA processing protein